MPLPNFLIIGTQKAGTSWLVRMLQQHPEVFILKDEVHFFNNAKKFAKGINWYASLFDGASDETAIGEKTPNYIWVNHPDDDREMHRRIQTHLPDCKLICILRDPIKRAVSAYNHHLKQGRLSPWVTIDDYLIGSHRDKGERWGLVSYGSYYEELSTFLSCFHRDRLLILIFEEDVVDSPVVGLTRVCRFLEVDPDFSFDNHAQRFNTNRVTALQIWSNYFFPSLRPLSKRIGKLFPESSKRTPKTETIEQLRDYYRPDMDKLFDLLGRRIETWES